MASFKDSYIELAHGAGGKASRRLVEQLIAPTLNIASDTLTDSAFIHVPQTTLAFTADSYVVRPLRFNGGSIGELAVNGTCNDLAVAGAKPLALLATFILEAGLSSEVLQAEVAAMKQAADKAGVNIVGGDTKVVEHGKADGLYLTTCGIGLRQIEISAKKVHPGDKVIISGPIGDHGITILLARGELDLEADLQSDTRSVWPLVNSLIVAVASDLKWLRDPTRGGVASVLNELARDTNLGIELLEETIPLRPAVRGACEILGLDPLHIANEGQFIAIVSASAAEQALNILQGISGGEQAQIIGTITEAHPRTVVARTNYGGSRVVDMLVGDPLPRIC